MKTLLSLLLFVLAFAATVPAQQTIDAVGLTGTLEGPDGTPVTGHLTVALNLANVKNICNTPYTTVPRGPITFTVTNGTIVNGSTASLITQDCMSPRSAYYISLYDKNNKLLFADNWYLRQQAIVNNVRAQNVGNLVEKGFGGPITVAVEQAVVTNPVGNQTITQPAGTNLIINSAICTGTCIGFGGSGTGSGVTSVGISLPSNVFNNGPAITSAGNLTATFGTQVTNTVFAGPCGGSAVTPTFRVLCASDIPNNNANTTGTAGNVSGVVQVTNGGTGTTTPALVAGNGISITGSFPDETISSTLVGTGSPTQIAKYGTGGVLAGDPNITDSGTVITFGTTVNMPNLTASLCIATDTNKNLVSVTCGSTTAPNSSLQFPNLGSFASSSTINFGAASGYASVTGTTTVSTITPYSGCSGLSIACVYAIQSTAGFGVAGNSTGGSTNNISTANGVGSVTPTLAGNIYFFIYDPTSNLWHMSDAQASIWQGAWSSAVTYNPGVLVASNNQTYLNLQALNSNNPPASSPTYWVPIGIGCANALCITNPNTSAGAITLASNQTSSQTTAVLTSIGTMTTTNGCFFIDSEWECYQYAIGNTLYGITRGAYNTTAAAHTTSSYSGVVPAMTVGAPGYTSGVVVTEASAYPILGVNNNTPGFNSVRSCCVVFDVNQGGNEFWVSNYGMIHQVYQGTNDFNLLYGAVQIGSDPHPPHILSSGDLLQAVGPIEAWDPIGFGAGIAGSLTVNYSSTVGAPFLDNYAGTGTTTRTYVCSATDFDGNLIPGTAASLTNTPTALGVGSPPTFISITCPWTAGIASEQVYRTVGGPNQGLLSSQAGVNGFQVFDYDTATTSGTPPGSNGSAPRLTVVGNVHQMCDTSTTPQTCYVLAAGTPTGCGSTYGIGSFYLNETGALGSTAYTCSPAGTQYQLGTTVVPTSYGAGQNIIVDTYITTGTNTGGYNVLTGNIYISTGGTTGDHIDVGLVAAPTATTQGTSWICHGTYTETGATGWISIPITGCGTLSPNTHYWAAYNTNDNGLNTGRYNCGSTCSGGSTTASYGGFSVSSTYGTYTGLTTSLTGPATTQVTEYITMTGTNNEWVSINNLIE